MFGIKRTTTNIAKINEFNLKGVTYSYEGDLAKIDNSLNVIGDVSFNSSLIIGGKTTLEGDVSFKSNAYVDGKLLVSDDVSFNSSLSVGGKTTLEGDVSLNAFLDVSDGLNVSGPMTLSTLVASSDVSFQSNAYVDGKLLVSDDVSFNNSLYVQGPTRLVGPVTIDGSLNVNESSFTYTKTTINSVNLDVSDNIIKINVKDISTNQTTNLASGIMVQDESSNVFFGYSGRKEGQEHSDKFVITKTTYNEGLQTDVSLSYDKPIDVFMNGSLDVSGDLFVNGSLQATSMVGFAYQVVGETNDLSAGEYPFSYGAGAYDQDEYFGYPISMNSKIVQVGIMLSDGSMVSGDSSINEIILDINGTDVSFSWNELSNFSQKKTKKYPTKNVDIQFYEGDMVNIHCKSLTLNNFPNRYDIVAVEKARIILKFLTTEYLSLTDIASKKIITNSAFISLLGAKGIDLTDVESTLNVSSTNQGEGLEFNGIINIKNTDLNTISEVDQEEIINGIQLLYADLLGVDSESIIVTLEAGSIIAYIEVYESPDKAALVKAPPSKFNPNFYWEQLGQPITSSNETMGNSVSINSDGKKIAIGSPIHRGSVDVYEYNDISWVQLGQRIMGTLNENTETMAGKSVSLSSNGLIVAFGEYTTSGGKIRILEYDTSWVEVGEPIITENNSFVSLNNNGNIIAFNDISSGIVKVYEYNDVSWVQLGNNITNEGSDKEGYSIQINGLGNIIIVGQPYKTNEGQARVFKYNSVTQTWDKIGDTIYGNSNTTKDGISVQINDKGTIAALSSDSDVNIYKYKNNNWEKMGNTILIDSLGVSGLILSISSYGHIVSVGQHSINNPSGGRLRIYEYKQIGNNWSQIGDTIEGNITGEPNVLDINMGHSLSLSSDGTTVCYGQLQSDMSGQVNVYKYLSLPRLYYSPSKSWQQLGETLYNKPKSTAHPTVETSYIYDVDNFGLGNSISADGMRIAIGGFNTDKDSAATKEDSKGYVKVYDYIDSSWVQIGGTIYGEYPGDEGGRNIILTADGSRLAVATIQNRTGQYNNNNPNPDHALYYDRGGYVKVYDYIDSSWVQVGNTLKNSGVDRYYFSVQFHFGEHMSLSRDGRRLAVGASRDQNADFSNFSSQNVGRNTGQVRVYEYNDISWVQIGQTFRGIIRDEFFGRPELNYDGSKLAISSPLLEAAALNSITVEPAHIITYNYDISSNLWVQYGKMGPIPNGHGTPPNENRKGTETGFSFKFNNDGNIITAGAPGRYYVGNGVFSQAGALQRYEYIDSSWVTIGPKVAGVLRNMRDGEVVSASQNFGNIIAVGTKRSQSITDDGTNRGLVTMYEYNKTNAWIEIGKIYGTVDRKGLGTTITLNEEGTTIIVSSPGFEQNNSLDFEDLRGSVQVFKYM